MKQRLLSMIATFVVCFAVSMSSFSRGKDEKSMSEGDAEKLIGLLLKDKNYHGQVIVAYAKQLDENFYGFQMIRGDKDAGNFEFTTFDVNRFTGTVWLVVGSDCSIYTSSVLKSRQVAMKKALDRDVTDFEYLNSIKPVFCEYVNGVNDQGQGK